MDDEKHRESKDNDSEKTGEESEKGSSSNEEESEWSDASVSDESEYDRQMREDLLVGSRLDDEIWTRVLQAGSTFEGEDDGSADFKKVNSSV